MPGRIGAPAPADTHPETTEPPPPHPLSDGQYEPRPVHQVWTWPYGQECPEGFALQPNGDAVLLIEGSDQVDRDSQGNAGSMREGGALVYGPDGLFRTLTDDEAQEYADTHERKA